MTESTKTGWRKRDLRFEKHMSDAEALMWNVEKDPWLNPSGASILVLDQPVDHERFRRMIAKAVADIPRFRQRVVPSLGRLTPPEWKTDPEFDLDYHIRNIALPSPGTERQLLDLATRLYEDPYDRTRPVWMFFTIEGLEGGRGAMLMKLHHTLMDGIGAVRLSEAYMELSRDSEPPAEVDLKAVIDAALAEEGADADEALDDGSLSSSVARTAVRLTRRHGGFVRRAAAEVSLWGADPQRAIDTTVNLLDEARGALGELASDSEDEDGPGEIPAGSPLWQHRSRGRHLEVLRIPLDDAKRAAKELDGTVNDVMLTALAEGAARYHEVRNTPISELRATFVVSTRTDHDVGGNAFTPTKIRLPGSDMATAERFAVIHDRATARRSEVGGQGSLSTIAGVANLFPTSVITRLARSQAAGIDFATSNLRAAPFTVFVGGAEVEALYPMGPVAGTAFNATMISYDGYLHLGLMCDPAAIEDPGALRDDVAAGWEQVVEAGANR